MRHEPDQCAAGLGVQVKVVCLQGVDGKDITMRFSRRGACANKAINAQVIAGLYCAIGQFNFSAAAACRQRFYLCRNIDYDPVPKSRTGRSIRIICGDHKTFGAFRGVFPGKVG